MLNALLKRLNPTGREKWATFWRMILVWNPLFSLFLTAAVGRHNTLKEFAYELTVCLVIVTTIFLVLFTAEAVVVWARAAVLTSRGISPRELRLRWRLVVSFSVMPGGVYLGFLLAKWLFGYDAIEVRDSPLAILFLAGIAILSFLLIEMVAQLREAKTLAELRGKEVENEKLRGQVAALTAQMNPHLLFNTLNTIASLTQSDANAAEQTTVELAELYRGVLNAARRETHSLANEMAICRAYLSIERARFGDRLRFEVLMEGIDQNAITIPPLLLQPLVENAVKHGLAPKAQGGQIRIEATVRDEVVQLRVVDNGVGYSQTQTPQNRGTALENLRTRLELLYGSEAGIKITEPNEGGTMVEITMPKVAK